jgi:hypothetical protein
MLATDSPPPPTSAVRVIADTCADERVSISQAAAVAGFAKLFACCNLQLDLAEYPTPEQHDTVNKAFEAMQQSREQLCGGTGCTGGWRTGIGAEQMQSSAVRILTRLYGAFPP